jgi:hypothetical protein
MYKPSISLATLTLRLKDSANPLDKVTLNSFGNDSEKHDFLHITQEILSELFNNPTIQTALGNVAKIKRIEQEGRYIKGIFETGKTGTEQDIINALTKDVSYRTATDDAVMVPYYFLFYIPEDHHKAVIFLQRFKQSGIQTLLLDYFERRFKEHPARIGRYNLEIKYLQDTNTFNRMLEESRVKELRLTQTKWSPDRADNQEGAAERQGNLSVTYRPYLESGFELIDAMKKLVAKELTVDKVLETEFDFIDPDEASFVIQRNGKDRRINFTDTATNFRAYHDITKDVKFGNDGYPIFESIDKIALEILSELSQGLYESPSSQN